jgi:hypothetical protein
MGVPDRIRFDSLSNIGRDYLNWNAEGLKVQFKRGELEHYRRRRCLSRIGRRTMNEIKRVVLLNG